MDVQKSTINRDELSDTIKRMALGDTAALRELCKTIVDSNLAEEVSRFNLENLGGESSRFAHGITPKLKGGRYEITRLV